MNSLSSALKADYVELANNLLDRIPMLSEDDFEIVRTALKNLIKKNEVNENLPTVIKNKITSLKEFLDEPELFAEEHFKLEFTSIIIDRIRSKIKELKNMEPQSRQHRIEEFKISQEITATNKEKMAKAKPPIKGSEGHTISIEPEVIEQVKEILEAFFWKLNQIENILQESGMDISLEAQIYQRNSSIDIKEEDVSQFLQKNLEIPTFPKSENPEDIKEILCSYLTANMEAFEILGLNVKIQVRGSSANKNKLNKTSIRIDNIFNQLSYAIKQIGRNLDFEINLKLKCQNPETSKTLLSHLNKFLEINIAIPDILQSWTMEKVRKTCEQFIDSLKNLLNSDEIELEANFIVESEETEKSRHVLIGKIIEDFYLNMKKMEESLKNMGIPTPIFCEVFPSGSSKIKSIANLQQFLEHTLPELPQATNFSEIENIVSSYFMKYIELFKNIGFIANIHIDKPETEEDNKQFIDDFHQRMFQLEKKLMSLGAFVSIDPIIIPLEKISKGAVQNLKDLDLNVPEFSIDLSIMEREARLSGYLNKYRQAFHQMGMMLDFDLIDFEVAQENLQNVLQNIKFLNEKMEELEKKLILNGIPIRFHYHLYPCKESSGTESLKLEIPDFPQSNQFNDIKNILRDFLDYCEKDLDRLRIGFQCKVLLLNK